MEAAIFQSTFLRGLAVYPRYCRRCLLGDLDISLDVADHRLDGADSVDVYFAPMKEANL